MHIPIQIYPTMVDLEEEDMYWLFEADRLSAAICEAAARKSVAEFLYVVQLPTLLRPAK